MSNPLRRPPLQFSLQTGMLLIVLAAAAASLFVSYHQHAENQKLRREMVQLRNEVGELTIEPGDEDKLHAISIPSLDEKTWRWRVYVPAGRQFGFAVHTQDQNSSGSNWSSLSPGETSLTVSLRRGVDGQWQLVSQQLGDGSTSLGRQSPPSNLDEIFATTNEQDRIGRTTVKVEPGKDLDLFRLEAHDAPTSGSGNQTRTRSIVVRIQEGPSRP